MTHRFAARHLAAIVLLGMVLAACVDDATAVGSFDPSTPCNGADSQVMKAAYPDLEGLLPTSLAGVAPTSLVSGRLCSANTLGTLYGRGIHEDHFASAVWNRGGGSGIQMTVMDAAGLTVANVLESYSSGAANAPKVHSLVTASITVNGLAGMRVDIENDDYAQDVIVWPGDAPGRIRVVITSNIHEADLMVALADFH
ncbi:MAG: hypothetical protein ACRDGI_09105 [Candidatus Limnocylindrales bacterium]